MRLMTLLAYAALLGPALAQPNVRPGTDVSLGVLGSFDRLARQGTFPDGTVAMAMSTTSCNVGSVNVPWRAPMNSDHPFITFLVTRETGHRMEQISDRSFIKHGFFALSSSDCSPCLNGSDGTYLAIGCSDTYGIQNNADNFWLAPADEVDPFTGLWDPVCSHFDHGEPAVSPPFDCDGNRSGINPGTLGNRIKVLDADLNVPGSTFYYQGQYIIRGEELGNRKNNLTSRWFTPSWTGSTWNISVPSSGNAQVEGSVLSRWSGAIVTAASNGADDGTIYLGVKTVNLGNGFYRYEYALHNADNTRGVGAIRIPVCTNATVQNVGFHDIDADPMNDWSFSQVGNELVFSTSDNPVRWNTIYNFYFDCDATPSKPSTILYDAFDAGAGLSRFGVKTTVPLGPLVGADVGFGNTGSNGLVPEFRACGNLATGGQGEILLRMAPPSTIAFLVGGFTPTPTPLFGGTLVPLPIARVIPIPVDANGQIRFSLLGGGGPLDVYMQYVISDAGTASGWVFSNAIRASFQP